MADKSGLIQVYFGEGKGKTTAALGTTLRAAGQGMKVLLVQFFKNKFTGELASLQLLPGVDVYRFGSGEFIRGEVSPEDQREFFLGWHMVREALEKKEYDVVILDELPYAFYYHLLTWEECREALEQKNPEVEVIITGRKVPEELITIADLVSEIKLVKHPFNKGIPARRGFEY
ncbi:MAG TPA: cob(I)yrinic acid a,c-diamide adenosyltransferase [Candidatus Atribacteria bacterium]|uniref:cob(I)yrinic acid a,c-diamide adenosyltransferase n=1 Tax=Candidatus Sordicultor fermentans TaxID=1953203 RepID=UPI0016B77BFA|nr:cob(I)yrinic acid a,c-diamide adenosyltransferase [Atribacterota bacterium]NLY04743.1 cob(I)yrinic acid a,c-diamide adenosyltransferase [Candidatus Atribacteria bacterium]MDI9607931.1 cob(I)yrinic acid a,c-diamide adenosyltransferase [Atribacterota bacterium]MDY0134289.1 cob(I)yrinic acid a,c-diamide adenosyltransferase [Atribacterota bacterium]HOA98412.1 cob(I)yrinic acid a,c-diamide adenosyltransferase [Candidatus Atribacteria bacterium]